MKYTSLINAMKTSASWEAERCEFWGFHGGDVASRGVLGCEDV